MGVFTVLTDYIKNTFSKLNQYIILQLLWVIAIYYFVLNSLLDFISIIDGMTFNITSINGILEYNQSILDFLQKYEIIWIGLTILLFFASIIVILVTHTLFENYMFIRSCSKYGGELSVWSLIIYGTYKLYIFAGSYYGIVLFAISAVAHWVKEKKSNLLSRFY
ncbi:hypothetical protein SAMN05443428_10844 [Caloramator quimbayensis]|uniref:Uncharacterized protein n=1 Tax=Caloramator quimbayensis TaxID=1147123 RepID=A0A1T4XDR1_9CLOT|nr:hypothetical protein [Caloramator quimbayensis]SKA87703.1 hypothetical protein SAMN05443428_10844 [Caloramator quimbayensis]